MSERAEEMRLCRHMHVDGAKLSFRYTLSDGSFVGEIDIAARGGMTMMQMLAYDLLQVTSAWVESDETPETNAVPLMKGLA
ncbi:MAG TPA: hypothetical protein VMA37_04685 [Acetobacteraceae bacterium]|nr:hypothetical protein [Acetobacteraceae bacterium]